MHKIVCEYNTDTGRQVYHCKGCNATLVWYSKPKKKAMLRHWLDAHSPYQIEWDIKTP